MVQSKAQTVREYLNELPDDRSRIISTIRDVILNNLPAGYQETMTLGMISYEIPLETYPDTYNGQPLFYVALASQKRHMAIYMHGVSTSEKQQKILKDAFEDVGIKPNMGKSCIRFTKLEKIPLETIGELFLMISVDDYIARYESMRKK
ncbi:MAG: DUF1801 domain-containing protein [Candidatus Neomarinimicrobiota bacterium]|nr:DUF1801 domain-containing protein [Candidatus Neomarinimicrobiota bacterium]